MDVGPITTEQGHPVHLHWGTDVPSCTNNLVINNPVVNLWHRLTKSQRAHDELQNVALTTFVPTSTFETAIHVPEHMQEHVHMGSLNTHLSGSQLHPQLTRLMKLDEVTNTNLLTTSFFKNTKSWDRWGSPTPLTGIFHNFCRQTIQYLPSLKGSFWRPNSTEIGSLNNPPFFTDSFHVDCRRYFKWLFAQWLS